MELKITRSNYHKYITSNKIIGYQSFSFINYSFRKRQCHGYSYMVRSGLIDRRVKRNPFKNVVYSFYFLSPYRIHYIILTNETQFDYVF